MKRAQLLILTFLLSTPSLLFSQNIDVWDFGATQLSTESYNNLLNETIINSWYDSAVTPGSSGINLPVNFTSGALTWVGASSDRLRTTNVALTRFDANVASVSSYNGRIYCNATAPAGMPTARYISMSLNEDDEIKIIARGDTAGVLTFLNEANPGLQTDTFATTFASGSVTEVNFVASNTGVYRIFDQIAKASFYRIYRKAATYTNITGTIDVSQASGLPGDYAIVLTNAAGKTWTAQINSGNYTITVPAGYVYELNLVNASGYIISTGETLDTTAVTTPAFSHNIAISSVTLFTLNGIITGLGTNISSLSLNFIPDTASNSVYIPAPIINAIDATYTVQLEPNVPYTITAEGVNDFENTSNAITISANATENIVFIPKPVHDVSITPIGLTTEQFANINLTFTNLNENGYVYNFNDINGISLRNGTYSISSGGLNNYPVELGLTSNLTINGAANSKALTFKPVTVWSFNDQLLSTTTSVSYKGMMLSGQVTTVLSSGHLTAKTGTVIKVPVNPGEKISVSYYYTANFSIEGGVTITTATNSTSITEKVEYVYTGNSAGFVTINVGGASTLTSYFTEIKRLQNVAYAPEITVGTDKDYQTINAALNAISNMNRTSTDRVTILIDAGNYEEMLVINQPNVTLKNASINPNTNLVNAGVAILPGAVRITSYYGHGYSYYSMASDQKWHQDVLNVNVENGYASYQNAGSGTTNGSYWNATVVVTANGFEAENIIFENSFNQYISVKESQDVVKMWTTGSPGIRPTNAGNTTVQNRTLVERAAALSIANNIDKVILNKCRIVGRQDSFFGGTGARVAIYKGDIMGAVDYIFGGMNAVFYKSKLAMNVSDQSNDQAYITAAQQSNGRGYLMYECTVTSAEPLVETASVYRAKPGYFGRPWLAATSEVVFFNTTIETSDFPGSIGNSLIMPLGWQNTLGGSSDKMYEFGSVENSGVNNVPNRANWATSLASPILNDGTAITTFNFTKGNDNWDPFPALIANDLLSNPTFNPKSAVNVYSYKDTISVSNVKTSTNVFVYAINGSLAKTFKTDSDTNFTMKTGIWIVVVRAEDGQKSFKISTN